MNTNPISGARITVQLTEKELHDILTDKRMVELASRIRREVELQDGIHLKHDFVQVGKDLYHLFESLFLAISHCFRTQLAIRQKRTPPAPPRGPELNLPSPSTPERESSQESVPPPPPAPPASTKVRNVKRSVPAAEGASPDNDLKSLLTEAMDKRRPFICDDDDSRSGEDWE